MRRAALLGSWLLLAGCASDPSFEPGFAGAALPEIEVTPCRGIRRSGVLRVAPDPIADLQYRRCGTAGGETQWEAELAENDARLAALTSAGTVRLIDTQSWEELGELASPVGKIDAIAFSPDSRLLATLSEEAGQVALWDARTGLLARSFIVRPVARFMPSRRFDLTFSSDGALLSTSLQAIVDLRTDQVTSWLGAPNDPTQTIGGHGSSALFLQDDRYLLIHEILAAGGAQSTERMSLLQIATGARTILAQSFLSGPVTHYAITPDQRRIAIWNPQGLRGSGLYVYELGRDEPAAYDPSTERRPVSFSPDGTELYTSLGKAIEILDAQTLSPRRRLALPGDRTFAGFSPEGLLRARGPTDVALLDPLSLVLVETTSLRDREPGLYVATGSDVLLSVRRGSDDAEVCSLPRPDAPLPTLKPAPGSRESMQAPWIAARAADGSVEVIAQFSGHGLATDWYSLTVVDPMTQEVLRRFPLRTRTGAELSEDGARLMTLETSRAGAFVSVWCR